MADAHVRDGDFATTNYGTYFSLTTNNSTTSGKTYQSYLRFDISSLPTNSSSVKLRLYGNLYFANDPSVAVQVFNVPSITWGETTITFTNRPAAQTTVLASVNVSGTAAKYYEWDLTSFINSRRVAGDTAVSLQVKNLTVTNYNQVNFYSKEHTTNKPQLVAVTGTAFTADAPLSASKYEMNDNKPAIFIYPNPVKSFFTVTYPFDATGGILQVSNLSGKIILKQILTEKNKQTIEIFNQGNGIYILTIQKDDKKYSHQFIIEN